MVSETWIDIADQLSLLKVKTLSADLDLRAVLECKEKELELAARIGQTLLKRVATLEGDLQSAQTNSQDLEQKLHQLNHEVTHKDELLKWVDREIADREDTESCNNDIKQSLLNLNKECKELKNENSLLKDHQHGIKVETMKVEAKETALIQHCLNQLGETASQISKLEVASEQKSEEIVILKHDLNHVNRNLTELSKRHVQLIDDNNELRMQVNTMREDQKMAQQQLAILQKKYEECLIMLEDSRKYMHKMKTPSPSSTPRLTISYETPSQPTPSIMNELEDAIINDLQQRRTRTNVSKTRFHRTRARLAHRNTVPQETTDDSDNKDSGVKSGSESDESNMSELYKDSPKNKRRLRRGTASTTTSDLDIPQRDALQELISADSQVPLGQYSLHGSSHSVNSDTNITSVSDTWQSEPTASIINGSRSMYGTNKLKMVKPLEGSMTLLQWKLLAMKQTSNSLLTAEERPGVLQRNTVGANNVTDSDGIGGLGSLGDLGGGGRGGIFSKAALTPARGFAARGSSTPVNNTNGGGPGSEANDIFAQLSTKYGVSTDFSTSTAETRPGSKVKVATQPRTQYQSSDTLPDSAEELQRYQTSNLKKQQNTSSSSSIGRLFGWT